MVIGDVKIMHAKKRNNTVNVIFGREKSNYLRTDCVCVWRY